MHADCRATGGGGRETPVYRRHPAAELTNPGRDRFRLRSPLGGYGRLFPHVRVIVAYSGWQSGSLRLLARGRGFPSLSFRRLNTLRTLPASLGLRSECCGVLVAAPPPFQEAVDPRGGLADRFSDFPLGCALLFGSRDVLSGGTKRGLAGTRLPAWPGSTAR